MFRIRKARQVSKQSSFSSWYNRVDIFLLLVWKRRKEIFCSSRTAYGVYQTNPKIVRPVVEWEWFTCIYLFMNLTMNNVVMGLMEEIRILSYLYYMYFLPGYLNLTNRSHQIVKLSAAKSRWAWAELHFFQRMKCYVYK